MPDGLLDTATSDATPSVTGETADAPASLLAAAEHAELETLDDLLSHRGRHRLREIADVMKESGALKIKDHRTIQGNNPDTFKGEYVKDWILKNEKLVTCLADAMRVSQAMLDLNIFHSVTNSTIFDSKNLYAFREPGNVGGLGMLKNRIVAIEDYNIAQTKANKEAQAEAAAKTVQLDWRVSVTERRLEAAEGTLRRALVVQQVVLATLLVVLVLVYAPIWANVAVFMMSLVAVMLVVILLESRSILRDTLHLKVDYTRIANGIMGIVPDDEDEDGLASGRLEAQDTQDQAWSILLTTFRSRLGNAMSIFSDSRDLILGILTWWRDHGQGHAETQNMGQDVHKATGHLCNEQRQPRTSRVSLSGATRLISRASGRLAKVFGEEDRCNALRRKSAPVQCSTDIDAPVWPQVERPAGVRHEPARPTNREPTDQHTALPGPPTVRDFDEWWNGDMVVRQPAGEVRLVRPMSTRGRVRVNYGDSHAFDGPLFTGTISVWVKGLKLGEGCPDVFHKLRRRTWVIVQGRFKERMPVSRVYTGQAFKQPLEVVPKHVMRAAMMLLQSFTRVVSSASIIENRGAPIVMYPLILGAQVVNVAMPGNEPSMDNLEVIDDVRLLAPRLTDTSGSAPASESDRRAYFAKESNRQATFFDPQHVYTFHVRQHVVDVANYRLPTSLGSINLLSYLKGQPLRFMAVDITTQQHLWNLEAWHRQLLTTSGSSDALNDSSAHGASAPTESLVEVRSNASPTAIEAARHHDASFVSDSPLALSGDRSDVSDEPSGDALVSHDQNTGRGVFHSCSFSADTASDQQPAAERRYSAVNIAVPSDMERANSSSTPTPKPFLDHIYPMPPASEGQQLRSRLLATPGGIAPRAFAPRAANVLLCTAPAAGLESVTQAMKVNTSPCDKVSETIQQDGSLPFPRSLPVVIHQAPSSRASFAGPRTDVSQESDSATPTADSDTGLSKSTQTQQKSKKTKRLKNPFRRT